MHEPRFFAFNMLWQVHVTLPAHTTHHTHTYLPKDGRADISRLDDGDGDALVRQLPAQAVGDGLLGCVCVDGYSGGGMECVGGDDVGCMNSQAKEWVDSDGMCVYVWDR